MYPPAAADSTVFVAALDGKVYALTASSGELLWSYDTGSQAVKRPTVVDGVVYVNTEDGLHALDAETGDGLWLHSSSEVAPTGVDGTVFSVRNAGDVVALDAASGETVWGYGNGNGLMRHSLTVSGGMVYFGIDYDHLYASNASNGQMEWSHKINTTMYASPVVADGAVYAITFDGDLNALDASSGELLWHDQIPGNVSRLLEVWMGSCTLPLVICTRWTPRPEIGSGASRRRALAACIGTLGECRLAQCRTLRWLRAWSKSGQTLVAYSR